MAPFVDPVIPPGSDLGHTYERDSWVRYSNGLNGRGWVDKGPLQEKRIDGVVDWWAPGDFLSSNFIARQMVNELREEHSQTQLLSQAEDEEFEADAKNIGKCWPKAKSLGRGVDPMGNRIRDAISLKRSKGVMRGNRRKRKKDEMDGWVYTILTPQWKQEEDGEWYNLLPADDDDDETYEELSEEEEDEQEDEEEEVYDEGEEVYDEGEEV